MTRRTGFVAGSPRGGAPVVASAGHDGSAAFAFSPRWIDADGFADAVAIKPLYRACPRS